MKTSRQVNKEAFQKFVSENFKSKSECAKTLGISRSHLDGLLRGRHRVGHVLESRLKQSVSDKVLYTNLLVPEPILIGGKKVKEIVITDRNGDLLALINSDIVINHEEVNVECISDDLN